MAGNKLPNTMKEITVHDWEKLNFGGKLISMGRLYDRLVCRNCGARAKRFGDDAELDARSRRDPLMRECIRSVRKES